MAKETSLEVSANRRGKSLNKRPEKRRSFSRKPRNVRLSKCVSLSGNCSSILLEKTAKSQQHLRIRNSYLLLGIIVQHVHGLELSNAKQRIYSCKIVFRK